MSASAYVVTDAGCWEWQRATNNKGYGLLWNGQKMLAAHCHFYTVYKGEIANGMQIDHLCRNRKCVNPDHLEQVSQTENVRRGNATRLSLSNAEEIRNRHARGDSARSLAREFDISARHVHRIASGKRWADDKNAPSRARYLRKIRESGNRMFASAPSPASRSGAK